jgi:hypothetical protein
MIKSNKDLYQEINNIIEVLKSSGDKVFSQKLTDALSISTIPTEILGESRLALMELYKTELSKKLNIKNNIEESLRYLDQILQ